MKKIIFLFAGLILFFVNCVKKEELTYEPYIVLQVKELGDKNVMSVPYTLDTLELTISYVEMNDAIFKQLQLTQDTVQRIYSKDEFVNNMLQIHYAIDTSAHLDSLFFTLTTKPENSNFTTICDFTVKIIH